MEGEGSAAPPEEQTHSCKHCPRSPFPCGRSPGGHIRAHASGSSPTSSEAEEKPPPKEEGEGGDWVSEFRGAGGKGARYGLRENRKKTWRFHDPDSSAEREMLCIECGKGFSSANALFGHMRCHSARSSRALGWRKGEERGEEEGPQEEEGGGGGEEEGRDGSWEGDREKGVVELGAALSTPLHSEIRRELEDAALCLIMLSRDAGGCLGIPPAAIAGCFDKNFPTKGRVCTAETKRSKNGGPPPVDSNDDEPSDDSVRRSRPRRALAELAGANSGLGSCNLVGKGKSAAAAAAAEHKLGGSGKPPHGKNPFQCTTCSKTFSSYQALGGHRTSHKRPRSRPAPKPDGVESSAETSVSAEAAEEWATAEAAEEANYRPSKKTNHHECEICQLVFPSGQALGGHKRRHFSYLASSGAACRPATSTEEQPPPAPKVLDLNLPAPDADGQPAGAGGQAVFPQWWAAGDGRHQGEPLMHAISS